VFKRFAEFNLKRRGWVLIVIALILALSVVGTVFLVLDRDKINSDMMSYFPKGFETSQGLAFLESNFGIRGDSMLVVKGVEDDAFLREAVERIRAKDGVTRVMWYEDALKIDEMQEELKKIDFNFADLDFTDLENKINASSNAMIKSIASYLKLLRISELTVDTTALKSYLRQDLSDGSKAYVIVTMIEYSASSNLAYDLLDSIKDELSGREFVSTGMTETARNLLKDTMRDMPIFLGLAILAVVIILLITTSSLIEPLILLGTLVVSMVISMGVNYLYPSISVISFATTSVLQLALTADYAIFYMHVYKKHRKNKDALGATISAVPEAANSVVASGLTTIGGFLALYFMRFKIGADLSNSIIKGLVISILNVLILQPIMTYMLDSAIQKTSHDLLGKLNEKRKIKKPEAKDISVENIVRPVARFSVASRIVIIIVAAALIIPAFLGQLNLKYSYFQVFEAQKNTEIERIGGELGNQVILAVPLKTKQGTHKDFIEKLNTDPKVAGVVGAYSAINIDPDALAGVLDIVVGGYNPETGNNYEIAALQSILNQLSAADKREDYRKYFEELGIDFDDFTKKLDEYNEANGQIDINEALKDIDLGVLSAFFTKAGDEGTKQWFTLYTINIKGSTEDDAAARTFDFIKRTQNEFFSRGYSIGLLTGSYDMRKATPVDFLLVSLIGAAIIFVIVWLLLKNPLKSLLMVLIIELGIFINFAITYLTGVPISFMIYIIISSVQLGCTVDYAILFANTFENHRKNNDDVKECAVNAAVETAPAIFTSALLISSVCVVVYAVSRNLVIKQLTSMLARGAGLSFVLVMLLQTAVWSLFSKKKKEVDFEAKLAELNKKVYVDPNKETRPIIIKKPNQK